MMEARTLLYASILCFIVPSWAQQAVFITNFAAISGLAPCASTGYIDAVNSLTDDCNKLVAPTVYASCACLKNQNSIAISEQIVNQVDYWCSSTATDDITSALNVFSSYCAPVTPPPTSAAAAAVTAAAPTTQPVATPVAFLTNIAAGATLAPCASSGLLNGVRSATSDCPPLAGPTAQASCACLKDQNSIMISQYIVNNVEYYCSSTATDDVTSALDVFSLYCRTGAISASPYVPLITSIGPMTVIQELTSLAPCASTAFVDAVGDLSQVCNPGAGPTPFASCACANATNSLALSDSIVNNVEYFCSSTATADITSALAVFSSFCVLAGGASGPATAAVTGTGAVTYAGATPSTTFGVTAAPTYTDPGGSGSSYTDTSNSNGLTLSDKIALGCGIGVGVPATLAAIATLWVMCVRG